MTLGSGKCFNEDVPKALCIGREKPNANNTASPHLELFPDPLHVYRERLKLLPHSADILLVQSDQALCLSSLPRPSGYTKIQKSTYVHI